MVGHEKLFTKTTEKDETKKQLMSDGQKTPGVNGHLTPCFEVFSSKVLFSAAQMIQDRDDPNRSNVRYCLKLNKSELIV